MSEGRDHGFAHDLTAAFKRNLNFQYGGGDRSYAAGLSLALAHSFFQGQRPPQEMQQVLASELLRRGWNTNIAGAIAQSVFNASMQSNFTPLTNQVATEAERGSVAAQLSLGMMYA